MSKSWKAAESRIGIWLGAKGILKSGRLPLSGGNSGTSRSDSPHKTIFVESKRDRSYHSVIKRWLSHKEDCDDIPIIELEDGVICFHNSDAQRLVDGSESVSRLQYTPKRSPRALTLFRKSVKDKEESLLDKNKKVVCVCLVYHHHKGFWFVMKESDLQLWWKCILEARVERERLLAEEAKSESLSMRTN